MHSFIRLVPLGIDLALSQLHKEVTLLSPNNLWPNRLIGDQFLPVNERSTKTNITKFTKDSPLLPSGLLGPVKLVFEPVVTIDKF